MTSHLATCLDRVIDHENGVYGISVVFRDGTCTEYSPDDPGSFVRVLQPRAHPHHGSDLGLPFPGEMGVVQELHGGFLVWMGSIHSREHSQVDPTDGIEVHRHESGVVSQIRPDGASEWRHPSGLRITVSADGKALPGLQRVGPGFADPKAPAPALEISHPSGTTFHVSPDGGVTVKSSNLQWEAARLKLKGAVQVDGPLKVATGASGTLTTTSGQVIVIQDGVVTSIY